MKDKITNVISWCKFIEEKAGLPSLRCNTMSCLADQVFHNSNKYEYCEEMEKRFIEFEEVRDRKIFQYKVTKEYPLEQNIIGDEKSLLGFRWTNFDKPGSMTTKSDGFFNNEGFPPWDTWIAISSTNMMFSWVPERCRDMIDDLIKKTNPNNSYLWVGLKSDM